MQARLLLAWGLRPPWPALLSASLVGWVGLIGLGWSLFLPDLCGSIAGSGAGPATLDLILAVNAPTDFAVSWLLMLLAMTPPLLATPIRHLRTRSLARRRARAVGIFLAGYLAVWMAAGPLLAGIAVGLRLIGSVDAAFALGLAVALVWQVSPIKQTCLNRCHILPRLAPFGLRADRDCLRFGLVVGLWCVGACWALMLVPLTAERMHAALMLAAALIISGERLAPARPARWRLPPAARPGRSGLPRPWRIIPNGGRRLSEKDDAIGHRRRTEIA